MEASKVRQRPIRALTAAEFAASTEAAAVLRLNRLASGPRIAAVSVVMAVLAGCAVGPDFESPAAPDVGGYTSEPLAKQTSSADVKGGEAQRFIQNLDIPGQWWTLFHSEALNAMVGQALKNNPTLPAAEAALRLAWENVYAGEGAFFPTAVVSYSPSRNKTATGVVFTSASSGKPWFTLHTAQVAVAYAPDVFGGTRRQVESLMATAEFQRYQVEATYLTLTSNVVAAAVQEASLRGQIAATEEIIKIQTESLGILRKQFELGQVAAADVAAVEATLAQAQATLPPLHKQLAVQRDLLTAPIGRLPSREPAEKFELAALHCRWICRSACRRNWSSSVRTSNRPKRCCMRPAPRSVSPLPLSCRSLRLPAMPAPPRTKSINCLLCLGSAACRWPAIWARSLASSAACASVAAPPRVSRRR
jgi:hypothetical protein